MLIPLTIAPSQRRALSDAQTRERALAGGSSSCIATCEVPLLHFEVPHCTCGFLYCYRLMLRSLELMAVEATLMASQALCETQISESAKYSESPLRSGEAAERRSGYYRNCE